MGYAVGWDTRTGRFRGYGVPATCEEPGCEQSIDRGLGYACQPDAEDIDSGCGLFFCPEHLHLAEVGGDDAGWTCVRCLNGKPPHELKPEHRDWLHHVLTDDSWAQWRDEEPELAAAYAAAALSGPTRHVPEDA